MGRDRKREREILYLLLLFLIWEGLRLVFLVLFWEGNEGGREGGGRRQARVAKGCRETPTNLVVRFGPVLVFFLVFFCVECVLVWREDDAGNNKKETRELHVSWDYGRECHYHCFFFFFYISSSIDHALVLLLARGVSFVLCLSWLLASQACGRA